MVQIPMPFIYIYSLYCNAFPTPFFLQPFPFFLQPSFSFFLLPSAVSLLPSPFFVLPSAFFLQPSSFVLLRSSFSLFPSAVICERGGNLPFGRKTENGGKGGAGGAGHIALPHTAVGPGGTVWMPAGRDPAGYGRPIPLLRSFRHEHGPRQLCRHIAVDWLWFFRHQKWMRALPLLCVRSAAAAS